MKIFVTGVNGFIGTHFTEHVLAHTDWEISGFDIASDNLAPFMDSPRFSFHKGDVFKETEWMEEQVKWCDVVLPLAGIAKPAYYIEKPVWTFELDFEQNLKLVRMCAKHGKKIVFPSTSEVYGMSGDALLREDESPLITGPICKTRWIYSCSKQMMDRMIFAYGQEKGMKFSIFRPFNWIGARLDTFKDAQEHKARSITQIIYDVLHRGTVTLVNGGEQRRSFTWVEDGIEGLTAIIADKDGKADGQIFNLGNSANNYSVRELAEIIIDEMKKFPCWREKAEAAKLQSVPAAAYYGKKYDDMMNRVPSIEKMERLLGWRPKTGMREMIHLTLQWYADQDKGR